MASQNQTKNMMSKDVSKDWIETHYLLHLSQQLSRAEVLAEVVYLTRQPPSFYSDWSHRDLELRLEAEREFDNLVPKYKKQQARIDMSCLPNDVIINNILSHLYPSDLEKCKDVDKELKKIINDNEEYIDKICQHIQPHGEFKTYYENDQLSDLENYKEGKLHGECKSWYENGQLKHQVYYKEGKLHGECKSWWDNGQSKDQTYYKEGKLHGESKLRYSNGNIVYQCNYKEGKLHGESKHWHENGQLHIQRNYKEGKQHGECKEYYENGQLSFQTNYKEGKEKWRI